MDLVRPDQSRYELFCEHLNTIDATLERFAASHDFSLAKNLHRQPGRDLKRLGAPLVDFKKPHHEFISINTSDHWRHATWTEDMPHDVGVTAYYYPNEGKDFYKRVKLYKRQPFSFVEKKLEEILLEGLFMLNSWLPPVISQNDPDVISDGWTRFSF